MLASSFLQVSPPLGFLLSQLPQYTSTFGGGGHLTQLCNLHSPLFCFVCVSGMMSESLPLFWVPGMWDVAMLLSSSLSRCGLALVQLSCTLQCPAWVTLLFLLCDSTLPSSCLSLPAVVGTQFVSGLSVFSLVPSCHAESWCLFPTGHFPSV